MHKGDAFDQLVGCIRDYNEALENYQSEVSEISEISEPFDVSETDPDQIEREIIGRWDMPNTNDLERAAGALSDAIDTFKKATSAFDVYVTFRVEADDEDDARDRVGQALDGLVGSDCDGRDVTFVEVTDVAEPASE